VGDVVNVEWLVHRAAAIEEPDRAVAQVATQSGASLGRPAE
jgi:hypothetical protein